MMAAGESSANYPRYEVTRRSPIRIHNVMGEYAFYYLHHEGVQFVAKRLHDTECYIYIGMCILFHYQHS